MVLTSQRSHGLPSPCSTSVGELVQVIIIYLLVSIFPCSCSSKMQTRVTRVNALTFPQSQGGKILFNKSSRINAEQTGSLGEAIYLVCRSWYRISSLGSYLPFSFLLKTKPNFSPCEKPVRLQKVPDGFFRKAGDSSPSPGEKPR